jgi:PST family polysaccharide transporter
MGFRFRSISPAGWITAEKITQQVLWLILFAVLAPILGPRPYGLFSIVMVLVGFCDFVLGDGAAEALVTVETLDPERVVTANTATGVLALAVSLLLVVLAPVEAWVFHDSELTWMVWALVPLPVLSLFSAAPIAILRRTFQYKRLAIRSIASLTVGGLFGIALAVAGAGVWALVFQVLTQRLVEVVVAWMSIPQRFRFGWSASHYRDMHTVSMHVFTGRVMIFTNGQLPRLILGYTLGPTPLGLYALATRFLDVVVYTLIFPRTEVGRIEMRTLPIGTAEFKAAFAKMVEGTALLAFPVILGAVAMIPSLFRLWLDPRWLPGILPAQLLLLSGLPLVLTYGLDVTFLATRNSAIFTRMATLQAATIVLTVLCCAPFGLNITCLALAVRPWLLIPIYLSTFQRKCHLTPSHVLALPSLPFIGAVVMAGVLNLPVSRPHWLDARIDFIALIASGMLIYGLFLYQFSPRQLRTAVKSVIARKS